MCNFKKVSLGDENYPSLLAEIYDPPQQLYIRGKLPKEPMLSVIGTRAMSDYGKRMTDRIASSLKEHCVVSGLALGVDGQAHLAALTAEIPTVAVLGSGVDEVYPKTNAHIAERILKSGGAIISEYPPGTKPRPHHFPERNRIIAGLSLGTVIIEAGMHSGALITARHALEEGREVFAVPTAVGPPSGTNYLIKRGEAKLIEHGGDIFDDFGQESLRKRILKRLEKGPCDLSKLSKSLGVNISLLSHELILLAQQGEIREINRQWELSNKPNLL